MTADERLAQCMQVGGDLTACQDLVLEETVGGVWCDGAVVYDERGKRCVTRAMLDRVAAARAGIPLPRSPVACPLPSSSPSSRWPLALVVAGIALGWYVLR